MAILFLRQWEGLMARQGSRATRDGRRPLVTQQPLAACFGVPQPDISRWERYWLERDWANLLSLHSAEVLTVELREQIVDVLARFPWWGQERVYEHLWEQGIAVTLSQVSQAARDSGWARLKATLKCSFVLSAECLRPRDEGLLTKLEAGEGLTPEERLEIGHLRTLCKASSRAQETDKALGVKLGVDDYVAKPFSLKELKARIEAILVSRA